MQRLAQFSQWLAVFVQLLISWSILLNCFSQSELTDSYFSGYGPRFIESESTSRTYIAQVQPSKNALTGNLRGRSFAERVTVARHFIRRCRTSFCRTLLVALLQLMPTLYAPGHIADTPETTPFTVEDALLDELEFRDLLSVLLERPEDNPENTANNIAPFVQQPLLGN